MSSSLERHQQTGDLHFITFSCVRHRPILGTPQAQDKFLEILEQTRQKHLFDITATESCPLTCETLKQPQQRTATPKEIAHAAFSLT